MNNYLEIHGRKIGPDFKPFVIAEVGINHEGQINKARKMVDDAMADFRKTYIINRIRFTLRYNPRFFRTIVSNPPEFFKAMRALIHYYLNIVFDVSNGPESTISKLLRKIGRKRLLPTRNKQTDTIK